MKFKKLTALLAVLALLCTTVSCGHNNTNSQNSSAEIQTNTVLENAPAVRLENHMTEQEYSRVSVGALTLLEDNAPKKLTEDQGKVKIYWQTVDERRKLCEAYRDDVSEEEYENMLKALDELNEEYLADTILVDNRWYYSFLPTYGYHGGYLEFDYVIDGEFIEDGQEEQRHVAFDSFEDMKENGRSLFDYLEDDAQAEQCYQDMITVFQSVIDNTYEEISAEEAQEELEAIFAQDNTDPFNGYYKDVWEYNRNEVAEIQDFIQEISIYDEELDTNFLVHVTLPPDYDTSRTYPMFVFSDGVWRFGNCPTLRKLMEHKEIQDVILVTIGYDYQIDGTNMAVRSKYLYENRDKMLDFMTDNLAPYLSELYHIDFTHSGFYGHSAGGVMSHYAVFHADQYENQPFQYYIIGSPALWQLHRLDNEKYSDAGITDYHYWDNHDTLDKTIFLCGGENEDPEYEEYYEGYDTTLEGIAHLKERLENHGVNVQCKIYEDSGHWQFIPDMFVEFFKTYYAR